MINPQKDAFFKLAIETGMSIPEQIKRFMPLGSELEECTLEKWLEQFTRLPKKFASSRRYVNRFKLGADPEFVFTRFDEDCGKVARVNASSLGLAQGPAFGADNNGRLAEIRPYPSRSVVEVVASILTTLRWMAILNPNTMAYEWQCGAFLWDDGLGGHVHFGRKRPFRDREIKALDAIEEGLLGLGVFPTDQIKRRRQGHGPGGHNVYGLPGDFRLQAHGYEYRTFPSWLDSPELAFLTIVVSKLVVQRPDLYAHQFNDPMIGLQRLRNFLSYFKNSDDDARLAIIMLDRGLPVHRGGDFKSRWGIGSVPIEKINVQVVPLSIKPDKQSIVEVFEGILYGNGWSWRVPEFTWGPVNPPKGMKMCLGLANTIQAKGLGEMIWDLCVMDSRPIAIHGGTRGEGRLPLMIPNSMRKVLPRDWEKRFEGLAELGKLQEGMISISPEFREGGNAKRMKRLLLNGVLPIWKVGEVDEGTRRKYLESLKTIGVKKSRFLGNVVYSDSEYRIGPIGE